MAVGRQRTIHHWKFWGSLSAVDGTQLPGVNWSSSSYLPVKYCHGHQHAGAAILTNIVMAVTTQAPSCQLLWVSLCSLWGFNAFLTQWPGLHMCLGMGSIMFSAHLWAKEQDISLSVAQLSGSALRLCMVLHPAIFVTKQRLYYQYPTAGCEKLKRSGAEREIVLLESVRLPSMFWLLHNFQQHKLHPHFLWVWLLEGD